MVRYMAAWIRNRIPTKIIRTLIKNPLASLEDAIIKEVIYPYLLTDLNLVGGVQKRLTVDPTMVFRVTDNEIILEIPPELRNGVNIKTVDSLITNGDYDGTIARSHTENRDLLSSPVTTLNDQNAAANVEFETSLTVIGNKYISIKQDGIDVNDLYNSVLTIYVEYPKSFDGIGKDYWPEFAQLALLATKMHLYNTLELELDEAFIQNSQLSDKLQMKVDSYSDAEMQYFEQLDTLGKFSFLNNKEQMGDIVKYMT